MNHCVISGCIGHCPALRLVNDEMPMAVFSLYLAGNRWSGAWLTVVCEQALALAAAKHLKGWEYVVVEGYLCGREMKSETGQIHYDIFLTAREILSCEGFRLT